MKIPRRPRFLLFGFLLGHLGLGPASSADTLVLRDGSRVETQGAYEVKGRQIVFKDKHGQLSSMRLDGVDLEATRRLAEAPTVDKPNRDSGGPSVRQVDLPAHGKLAFELPPGWKYETQQPPGEIPPTLQFRVNSVDVKLLITPLWSPKDDSSFNSKEQLLTAAKGAAELMRPGSTREPTVEDFEGASGYWFWVADKAPKKGEYPYAVQGVLATGKLQLIFTLLTHDEPPKGLDPYFRFLTQVRQNTN